MRRKRYQVRRQFGGQDDVSDDRDSMLPVKEMSGLVMGPDGLDVQTPAGNVRAHDTEFIADGQIAESGSTNLLGVSILRLNGRTDDALSVHTREGASLETVKLHGLKLTDRKGIALSTGETAEMLAGKRYKEGYWPDGSLSPDGFPLGISVLDQANPDSVQDNTNLKVALAVDGDSDTETRSALRFGAMIGDSNTAYMNGAPDTHLLNPVKVTIEQATLRLKVASVANPDYYRPIGIVGYATGMHLAWVDCFAEWEDTDYFLAESYITSLLNASGIGFARPVVVATDWNYRVWDASINDWAPVLSTFSVTLPAGTYLRKDDEGFHHQFTMDDPISYSWESFCADNNNRWDVYTGQRDGEWTVGAWPHDGWNSYTSLQKARAWFDGGKCFRYAEIMFVNGSQTSYRGPGDLYDLKLVDEIYLDARGTPNMAFRSFLSESDLTAPDVHLAGQAVIEDGAILELQWEDWATEGTWDSDSGIAMMKLVVATLDSRDGAFFDVADATWNERDAGTAWDEAGGGPVVSDMSTEYYLGGGIEVDSWLEIDVSSALQDYLENGAVGNVVQFLLSIEREAGDDSEMSLTVDRDGIELSLLYSYEYSIDDDPDAEPAPEEGIAAIRAYDERHGPLSPPWMVRGSGLILIGQAGMRPLAWDGATLFNSGLRAVQADIALSLNTSATEGLIPAGTYEYRITRYDSRNARTGESIGSATIELTDDAWVDIAASSFAASDDEYYNAYRVWRRDVQGSDEFYLVGTVAASTAEAGGFTDTKVEAEAIVLTWQYRGMPAYRTMEVYNNRFWGGGLMGWKLPGTTVGVVQNSKEVTPGGPPWFGSWLDGRTMLLDGIPYLIDYAFVDSGVTKLQLHEAYEGESGNVHWEVREDLSTIYAHPRDWGYAEMIRADGLTQVSLGAEEALMKLKVLKDRLFAYTETSTFSVVGGDWPDLKGMDIPRNDIDYWRVAGGVGIAGPKALAVDDAGNHWLFSGYDLHYNNGEQVVNVTKGKLRKELEALDQDSLEECGLVYDVRRAAVRMVGLRLPGETVPSVAIEFDTRTGAVCPIEHFHANVGVEL